MANSSMLFAAAPLPIEDFGYSSNTAASAPERHKAGAGRLSYGFASVGTLGRAFCAGRRKWVGFARTETRCRLMNWSTNLKHYRVPMPMLVLAAGVVVSIPGILNPSEIHLLERFEIVGTGQAVPAPMEDNLNYISNICHPGSCTALFYRNATLRTEDKIRLVAHLIDGFAGQDSVASEQLHDGNLHLEQGILLANTVARSRTERDVVVRTTLDFVVVRKALGNEFVRLGEHFRVAVQAVDVEVDGCSGRNRA
uniref:Uncharacterized protein n=1 Tax=Anopheles farauti TaxID=69004 RepID=A0A182QGL2_9DIPT